MGKDVKIGLMLGLGVLALIVIFWSSRPPVEIENQTALAPTNRPKVDFGFPNTTEVTTAQKAPTQPSPQGTEHSGISAPQFPLGMDSVQSMSKLPKNDQSIEATIEGAPKAEKPSVSPTLLQAEPKAAEQKAPAKPSVQTAQTKHKVKKGESLFALARKYYKDERQWRVIYDANRSVLPAPDLLYEGQVLVIPPLDKRLAAAKAAPKKASRTISKGVKTYKVQKGDSLFRIAQRVYKGDGTKWTQIYKANRRVLANANKVVPGQLLVIPK